ncbi:hypothetical protein [Bacteroides sp.]|uniref:hypothetical protein n=1 Tax=Bacteroides sp. TaxID=29523 RepID=UPI00261FE5BF|nr:hypothetical protein [Bacteroides sp.]
MGDDIRYVMSGDIQYVIITSTPTPSTDTPEQGQQAVLARKRLRYRQRVLSCTGAFHLLFVAVSPVLRVGSGRLCNGRTNVILYFRPTKDIGMFLQEKMEIMSY